MEHDIYAPRRLSDGQLLLSTVLVIAAALLPRFFGLAHLIPQELPSAVHMLFAMLPLHIGMFLAVAVPALFPPRPFRDVTLDLGLGKLTKDELKRIFKLSPLLFVVVMIVASIMTQIAKLCGAEDPDQALIKLALSADVPTFCVIFISSVFIAPVTEELAFRRTIFEKLHSSLPLQSAAAITSLLFALVHFSPWQIPPLFLLAFLFQQEYIRAANKTTATILMHAIYNGLTMLCLLALRLNGGVQ